MSIVGGARTDNSDVLYLLATDPEGVKAKVAEYEKAKSELDKRVGLAAQWDAIPQLKRDAELELSKAAEARSRAEQIVKEAEAKSKLILETAYERAQEIEGEAQVSSDQTRATALQILENVKAAQKETDAFVARLNEREIDIERAIKEAEQREDEAIKARKAAEASAKALDAEKARLRSAAEQIAEALG